MSYYFSDHLKTASVITDSLGNIKSESDYYPWGGELQFVNNDSNHYKFTGKERDAETGLDYFGARYYTNLAGRFITPDWAVKATAVPYAEFADPQSLNLYTYVRNRPTSKIDVDGHCEVVCASMIAAVATGGAAALGNLIFKGREMRALKDSVQAEGKLLNLIASNPNSVAAHNVDIDAVISSQQKHKQQLLEKGVEVASDAISIAGTLKMGASGTGSAAEKVVGKAIETTVDVTKTAVEADKKVDKARDAVQQSVQQNAPKQDLPPTNKEQKSR